MKGREIINTITQEKMPNIRQVRELCPAQPIQSKRGFKRLRLSTAAAIVAAFLLFATAAYAVAERVYQRVATGGPWDIVIFPDDDYGRQLYHERNEGRLIGHHVYWAFGGYVYVRRINAETARFINEQLEGVIYTADGAPIDFELAVSVPGALSFGRHYVDNRGNTLYTADGEPIGSITLFRDRIGELHSLEIRTKAQEKESRTPNSTYEEVRIAFGEALRLPTAHMEMFQPPCFDLFNDWPHRREPLWRVTVLYTASELTDIFDFCRYEMRIFIQSARSEDASPPAMYYLGGEAIAHYIAGVTVYELRLPEMAIHFVWEQDGLSYRFNPSPMFTPEQTMEVIESMILR